MAQTAHYLPEAKTIEIDGLLINYYETEGNGHNIFLIHGNSSSARSYLYQLNGLDAYHVVAVDLPGHGASQNADDGAAVYNMPGYAKVIVLLAKALNMEDAVFVGWSLGGHILLEATPQLPDAAGFVIFGTPPVGFPLAEDAFLPTPNVAIGFTPELSDEQMTAYVTSFFAPGIEEIPTTFMEDIAATDGAARANLGMSIAPGGYLDEIEVVKNLSQPLMVLHGEKEQLVNLDYIQKLEMPTLWNGKVRVIPDAGHAPHYETPNQFNELLDAFIEDISG